MRRRTNGVEICGVRLTSYEGNAACEKTHKLAVTEKWSSAIRQAHNRLERWLP
jgi:hypothetical protein